VYPRPEIEWQTGPSATMPSFGYQRFVFLLRTRMQADARKLKGEAFGTVAFGAGAETSKRVLSGAISAQAADPHPDSGHHEDAHCDAEPGVLAKL
jgi:hypothetical protein